MRKRHPKVSSLISKAAAATMLLPLLQSGCIFSPTLNEEYRPPSSMATPIQVLSGGQKESGEVIQEGIDALELEAYKEASRAFNKAVLINPLNAEAHFLNGFAYHMRALNGETDLFEYAVVGYRMAAKLDDGHKLAIIQLARLYLHLKRYRDAQDQFARGLLLDSQRPELLLGLATSSYLAQDLETAYGAIQQAKDVIPNDPKVNRIAALTYAALGMPKQAEMEFNRMKAKVTSPYIVTSVASRIEGWNAFYALNGGEVVSNALEKEKKRERDRTKKLEDGLAGKTQSVGEVEAEALTERMVFCEATIIRAETSDDASSGENFLKPLNLIANIDGVEINKNDPDDPDATTPLKIIVRKTTENISNILNRALKLEEIKYSLNIGNSGTSNFDLLSRPTLLAIEGHKASTTSGSSVNFVTSGGDTGSSDTQKITKSLSVSPSFFDDDPNKVLLSVDVKSADFEDRSASVVMNFGETLILSAVETKSKTNTRSGVPFLKDIPILGNFFGSRSATDTKLSTIILLTPHRHNYAKSDRSGQVRKDLFRSQQDEQPRLDELKIRLEKKFVLPACVNKSFVKGLKLHDFAREFSSKDVYAGVTLPKKEFKYISGLLTV